MAVLFFNRVGEFIGKLLTELVRSGVTDLFSNLNKTFQPRLSPDKTFIRQGLH